MTNEVDMLVLKLDDIYDNVPDMIKYIKESTGTTDSDMVIDFKLMTAHHLIKNYLNYDAKDMLDSQGNGKFPFEVVSLAQYLISQDMSKGLTQKQQGERSESYAVNSSGQLPQHIKDMLPLSKVSVI